MIRRIFFVITIIILAASRIVGPLYAATPASDLAAAENQFIGNCPDEPTVAVYSASANDELITELFQAAGDKLTILERSRLKDILAEHALINYLDPTTAPKMGKLLYAKYIATVDTDLNAGAPYDVNVQLIRTDTGEVVYEKSTTITSENPFPELRAFLNGASKEIADKVIAGNYECKDAENKLKNLAKQYKIFRLTMEFEFRNTSGCNQDRHTADIVISTQNVASGEKTPSGMGAGTMTHEPINRCKDTVYGGLRTINEPFLVNVENHVDAGGKHILLDPHDINENYFKDGRAYYSGSLLKPVFENAVGKNVKGTLANFVLPRDIEKKGMMKFKIKTPPKGGGWVEGTAVMELVDEGTAGEKSLFDKVFGGCQLMR